MTNIYQQVTHTYMTNIYQQVTHTYMTYIHQRVTHIYIHFFGCVYLFKIYGLGGELENAQLIF
jgi:hypothetical protein